VTDSLPYRPEVPDAVEVPTPTPAVAQRRRDPVAVAATVFVALSATFELLPLLALPEAGQAHFIDPFQLAALFGWSTAVAVGIPGIILAAVAVRYARFSGARRFSVAVLSTALATTLTPVIMVLFVWHVFW
jgi:hypothetical protein